jgi:GNAT superfamily N-acetyltransferase
MADIALRSGANPPPDWTELHALLVAAFKVMEGKIDPPSSLAAMTADSLRVKAGEEFVVLAERDKLVGCGFGIARDESFYLSKIGVAPSMQGQGVLRRMLPLFESEARRLGCGALTLQSRVEMTETHAAFEALGFRKVSGSSHPGFDRTTSLHFRKAV